MDIGQPHVSAAEAEGELFVVDSQQVEHGGVEVVDLDLVFNRLIAEFVGATVNLATAYSAPCHPDGKAEGIVISTVGPLGERGPAELSAPYH